jgi:hypothetical protein
VVSGGWLTGAPVAFPGEGLGGGQIVQGGFRFMTSTGLVLAAFWLGEPRVNALPGARQIPCWQIGAGTGWIQNERNSVT